MKLTAYLARQKTALALWAVTLALFWLLGWLYALPVEPLAYPSALSVVIGLLVLTADYLKTARRCRDVERVARDPAEALPRLPEPADEFEAAYQTALHTMAKRQAATENAARAAHDDELDYFTLWAHQIKTPLAALRLLLQSEPGAAQRAEWEAELLRIEQYVGMVLGYLRLHSDSNDLVLSRIALDPVLCRAIRQFARLFLLKKLTLRYEGTSAFAVTDAKWLGFIVEQLLSNAIKYTPPGGTITLDAGDGYVTVKDTGIGIAPEDLPRIFEKGYTGCNGRAEPGATGLGLYLSATAARKLGAALTAESEPGHGAEFTLLFPNPPSLYE